MILELLSKCNHEIIGKDGLPYLIKVELIPFDEWPATVKYKFAERYETDKKAQYAINDVLGITRKDDQVQKYAYCKNGGFDNKPDIDGYGKHTPEYFDCPLRDNCPQQAQRHLCGTIKVANGYLHPAEIEVIKLIAQDLADKEIADIRNVSYDTIAKQRANIIKKTGVSAKPGIVAMAFELGIIQ